MAYASVQTVMTLNENERTSEETIRLVLTAQSSDGGNLVGSLWYPDMQMQNIDILDAAFSNSGSTGERGFVSVTINLLSGQKFVDNDGLYAYTKVNGEPVAMDCVTAEPIKPNSKGRANAITLFFEDPPEGKSFFYPHVYFSTTDGEIDPSVGVRRRTPD